jgi:hypothetical protein
MALNSQEYKQSPKLINKFMGKESYAKKKNEKERKRRGSTVREKLLYKLDSFIDFLARWIAKLQQLQLLREPMQRCRMYILYADDALIFLQPSEQQVKLFVDDISEGVRSQNKFGQVSIASY